MKIASLCEKLGVLPQPGSLFEQDLLVVDRLLLVYEVLYDKEQADMKQRESEARVSAQGVQH